LQFGYDNNSDDDIDDAGDDLLIDESFGSTDTSFAYDHAGNLVDDGTYRFVFDAPALDSRLRQREPDARLGTRR